MKTLLLSLIALFIAGSAMAGTRSDSRLSRETPDDAKVEHREHNSQKPQSKHMAGGNQPAESSHNAGPFTKKYRHR